MARRSTKGLTKGLVLKNAEMRAYPPAFRSLWQQIGSNALQRGFKVLLTTEETYKLVTSPCHYCGIPPQPRVFGSMRYTMALHGLDRLDPKKDYTPANTVPACKICNRVKHVSTPEEYIEHAKRIVAFQAGQK